MNHENNSLAVVEMPVKRKRGRPRKNDGQHQRERKAQANSKPEVMHSSRYKNLEPTSIARPMVGQTVSGFLDGSFDAGYLVTVKVDGTDKYFHGLVFMPGCIDPVSEANDVVPHMQMVKSNEKSFDLLNQVNTERPMKFSRRSKVSHLRTELPQVQVTRDTTSEGYDDDTNYPLSASPLSLQQAELGRERSELEKGVTSSAEALYSEQTSKLVDTSRPVFGADGTPVAADASPLVTTQLIVELTKMLQENQALRNSHSQPGVESNFPVGIQSDQPIQSHVEDDFPHISDLVDDVKDDVAVHTEMPSSSGSYNYYRDDIFKDLF